MKKMACVFVGALLLSGTFAYAGAENSLLVAFRIGDTIISPGSIEDVRNAISKMIDSQTTCMNERGVTVDSMLKDLLATCQSRRALLDEENDTYGLTKGFRKFDETGHSVDTKLQLCLQDVEYLKQQMANKDIPVRVALNPSVDLDACIANITIDESAYDPFGDVMEDEIVVRETTNKLTGLASSSIDYGVMQARRANQAKSYAKMLPIARTSWIQNLMGGGLNGEFIGPDSARKIYHIYSGYFHKRSTQEDKSVTLTTATRERQPWQTVGMAEGAEAFFPATMEIKQPAYLIDKALIFNGHSLIACENGVPRQLGRPVFSGFAECHSGADESVYGSGNLPDGVYILDPKDKQTYAPGTDGFHSYGALRIRLTPTYETETYGRENFYLHGNDDDRPQSAGCISMGTMIDEFVGTSDFMSGNRIMLIVKKDTSNEWFNIQRAYDNARAKGAKLGGSEQN